MRLEEELKEVHVDIKLQKQCIQKLEDAHAKTTRKVITTLEEPQNRDQVCTCNICAVAEKIHLHLENETSRYTYLAERVDHQMWNSMKHSME